MVQCIQCCAYLREIDNFCNICGMKMIKFIPSKQQQQQQQQQYDNNNDNDNDNEISDPTFIIKTFFGLIIFLCIVYFYSKLIFYIILVCFLFTLLCYYYYNVNNEFIAKNKPFGQKLV